MDEKSPRETERRPPRDELTSGREEHASSDILGEQVGASRAHDAKDGREAHGADRPPAEAGGDPRDDSRSAHGAEPSEPPRGAHRGADQDPAKGSDEESATKERRGTTEGRGPESRAQERGTSHGSSAPDEQSSAETEHEAEAAREASRQRRRLESTLRDVVRRAIERGVDAGLGALEQSVDVLERSVEAGRGSVKSANTRFRDAIEDVRIPKELPKEFASLPKDVVNMLFTQFDEGKSILIGAVAKEVREFLDQTDVAYELQRVLTSLSFEISTEIRFVPNERGMPRAEVRSKARPKVSSRRVRKRSRENNEEEAEEE